MFNKKIEIFRSFLQTEPVKHLPAGLRRLLSRRCLCCGYEIGLAMLSNSYGAPTDISGVIAQGFRFHLTHGGPAHDPETAMSLKAPGP